MLIAVLFLKSLNIKTKLIICVCVHVPALKMKDLIYLMNLDETEDITLGKIRQMWKDR